MEPVIKNGVDYGVLVVVNIDGILACVCEQRAKMLGFDVTNIDPSTIDFNLDMCVCLTKGYAQTWIYVPTGDIRRLFGALMGKYKDWELTVYGAARILLRRTDEGEIVERSYRDFYFVNTEEELKKEAKYVF